jgi:hypothetical protein
LRFPRALRASLGLSVVSLLYLPVVVATSIGFSAGSLAMGPTLTGDTPRKHHDQLHNAPTTGCSMPGLRSVAVCSALGWPVMR